jgi:hypothetical protein
MILFEKLNLNIHQCIEDVLLHLLLHVLCLYLELRE